MAKKTERIEIECPVRVGDAVKNQKLPHKILIMAPLSGAEKPPIRAPVRVTQTGSTSLEKLMQRVKPTVTVDLDGQKITLAFERPSDFGREGVEKALAKQSKAFGEKRAKLRRLRDFQEKCSNIEGLDQVADELKGSTDLRDVLSRGQSKS